MISSTPGNNRPYSFVKPGQWVAVECDQDTRSSVRYHLSIRITTVAPPPLPFDQTLAIYGIFHNEFFGGGPCWDIPTFAKLCHRVNNQIYGRLTSLTPKEKLVHTTIRLHFFPKLSSGDSSSYIIQEFLTVNVQELRVCLSLFLLSVMSLYPTLGI